MFIKKDKNTDQTVLIKTLKALIVEKDQKNDQLVKKLQKYEMVKENPTQNVKILNHKEVVLKKGKDEHSIIKNDQSLQVNSPTI